MRLRLLSFNAKLAIALAVSLCLWMLTGLVTDHRTESELQNAQNDASVFSVRVYTSEAQNYQPHIFVRARTEASRRVMVAAQVDGQILATPAQEGQWVEQGAALCELNPEDRKLHLQQALAQLEKARIDYDGAVKLKGGGLQSQTQIAAAKASLAIAEAQQKSASIALENLVVRAPFSGVVQERLAEVGAFLTRGAGCASLVDLSPLRVSGNVAEADLSFIKIGALAKVVLLDKSEHEGAVTYVSRVADTLTRSFKVDIEIPNPQSTLADGLSADVLVLSEARPAHLIAPSILSMFGEGKVGVKLLDESNIVFIAEVRLLGDSPDGVWVSGLPDRARIIRVGQEYVSEGNRVNVVAADDPSTQSASTLKNRSVKDDESL